MNRTLSLPFTIAGTLAADHTFTFKVPFDCQIIHVSMSNSTANAGTLDLGTAADPDGYLDRRQYKLFGSSDVSGYYDIVRRNNGSDFDELWISEKPSTGESIEVQYLGTLDNLDDDSDVSTVPDRHLELLVLFVRWTAYQELAMTESANPDPTNLAMGTLELNAYPAKREYRIKLEDYKRALADSATARWRMDKWDWAY